MICKSKNLQEIMHTTLYVNIVKLVMALVFCYKFARLVFIIYIMTQSENCSDVMLFKEMDVFCIC